MITDQEIIEKLEIDKIKAWTLEQPRYKKIGLAREPRFCPVKEYLASCFSGVDNIQVNGPTVFFDDQEINVNDTDVEQIVDQVDSNREEGEELLPYQFLEILEKIEEGKKQS